MTQALREAGLRSVHGTASPAKTQGAPATTTQVVDLPDDLEQAILDLKKERNAILLAHYYQESEIQDLADVVGDSLQLAQAAQKVDVDVIAFCGVHFMAETAKILNPETTVVVPDLEAGCSLADGCPADELAGAEGQAPGREGPHLHQHDRRGEGDQRPDLHLVERGQDDGEPGRRAGDLRAGPPPRTLGVARIGPRRSDRLAGLVHRARTVQREGTREAEGEVTRTPRCSRTPSATRQVLDQADFIASTTGIIKRAVETPSEDGDHRDRGRRLPPDPAEARPTRT